MALSSCGSGRSLMPLCRNLHWSLHAAEQQLLVQNFFFALGQSEKVCLDCTLQCHHHHGNVYVRSTRDVVVGLAAPRKKDFRYRFLYKRGLMCREPQVPHAISNRRRTRKDCDIDRRCPKINLRLRQTLECQKFCREWMYLYKTLVVLFYDWNVFFLEKL